MKTYTIKEVSHRYDIPASTLRYYEYIGLLTNIERNESNQRIYTEEHLCRLESINCFKNTGLPLAKIQEFYLYESDITKNIEQILNLVIEHEENTRQQISKMQRDLAHIQHKVRYYHAVRTAIEQGEKWPQWDEI